jgi:hypothetical protein
VLGEVVTVVVGATDVGVADVVADVVTAGLDVGITGTYPVGHPGTSGVPVESSDVG